MLNWYLYKEIESKGADTPHIHTHNNVYAVHAINASHHAFVGPR